MTSKSIRMFTLVAVALVAVPASSLAKILPPKPVLTAAPAVASPFPARPENSLRTSSPQVRGPSLAPNTSANASGVPEAPPLSAAGNAPTSGASPAIAPMSGLLPLGTILREAEARNPDLIAARSLVVSAQTRVVQAARAPLQFVVQPALTSDVPGGIGRLQQLAAGLSQQVSPGINFARAVAAYDVTLARGLAEATSRDVRGRIVDGYYASASSQFRIAAAEQNVRSAKDLVTIVRLRERAGAVGGFEVLRVMLELRRAQSELAQARSSLVQNAIALGALVGRPVDPAATLPIETQPSVDAVIDAAKNVDNTLTRDPTSTQLRATLARSSAQLDAARALRRPALSISAGYLLQRAPDSGNRSSRGVTASLGVSFPVRDFGTIRGAELEARANAATARAQIAGRELQVRAGIAALRAAIETSRSRLVFSGESLRQANKGMQIAQFGFRQGALGTLDIISAHTAATIARTERDQARGDYAAAVAKLRILLGDPLAP